jgi:hypothetical protein
MKVMCVISIVAVVLYFEDQNNYGGYHTDHLAQHDPAIDANFGFH